MYICHVFKEDDIRVNYLPCTYWLCRQVYCLCLFCNMDSERIMFTDIVTDTF